MVANRELKLSERLIVAVDIESSDAGGAGWRLRDKLLRELDQYAEEGVVIKLNSVLRALGYGEIDEVHDRGLGFFADLKLIDIPATMKNDGEALNHYTPEIVTVMAFADVDGIAEVVNACPDTEVLAVTVLTSMSPLSCQNMFGKPPDVMAGHLSTIVVSAGVGGFILSPKELAAMLPLHKGKRTLNCPGVRPAWYQDENDDQKRVMTPKEAILAGADRLVMGRPIRRAKNPKDAIRRTLDEIQAGLDARGK